MVHKILFLSFSIALYIGGSILWHFYDIFGNCLGKIVFFGGEEQCWSGFTSTGIAIKNSGLFLLSVATLLLFTSQRIFLIWWKYFAIWVIPLFAIILMLQNDVGHAYDPLQPGKIKGSLWLGTIFLVVSALIIFFKNKSQRSK